MVLYRAHLQPGSDCNRIIVSEGIYFQVQGDEFVN